MPCAIGNSTLKLFGLMKFLQNTAHRELARKFEILFEEHHLIDQARQAFTPAKLAPKRAKLALKHPTRHSHKKKDSNRYLSAQTTMVFAPRDISHGSLGAHTLNLQCKSSLKTFSVLSRWPSRSWGRAPYGTTTTRILRN